MASEQAACSRCRFFQHWNDMQGECRRYPPAGGDTPFNKRGDQRWPVTKTVDWCGEWVAREDVKR